MSNNKKDKIEDAYSFPPGINPSKKSIFRVSSPKVNINGKVILFTVSIILISAGIYSAYFYISNLNRLKVYIGEGYDQIIIYDDEIPISFDYKLILSKTIYFNRLIQSLDYSSSSTYHDQKKFSTYDEATNWIEAKIKLPKIVRGIYHTLINMNMSEARQLAPYAYDSSGNFCLFVGNTEGLYYRIGKFENGVSVDMYTGTNIPGWNFFIARYIFPDRTTVEAVYLFNLTY